MDGFWCLEDLVVEEGREAAKKNSAMEDTQT